MKQTMNNKEITITAQHIIKEFSTGDIVLPVKVNFYIQKNIKTLTSLLSEIEYARVDIGKKHGELDDKSNIYKIREDEIQIAQNEINELYDIEQEVEIYKVKLDDLGDINLTMAQMEALMFMIDE